MLKTLIPIDKFIVSPQMPALMEMLSGIIIMSVLNILKNATFAIDDDDGSMRLDVTSLPSELQTLSVENVMAQLSTMQNSSNQAIQQAEMQIKQAEVQRKAQKDATDAAISKEKLNLEKTKVQLDAQEKGVRLQADKVKEDNKLDLELFKTTRKQ